MSTNPRGRDRIVDFDALMRRLRRAAAALLVVAFVVVVVDGLVRGLTFGIMLLWASVYAVVLVLLAAALVAVDALRGASETERRGERLSGPDVGFLPRRERPPR